jgi:DNA-binding MarR family transcriptional regulator
MVDRLERDGLVKRQRCEEDGRVVRLVLTDDGVALLGSSLAVHRRHLAEEIGARLDPRDVEPMERGLDRLRLGQARWAAHPEDGSVPQVVPQPTAAS